MYKRKDPNAPLKLTVYCYRYKEWLVKNKPSDLCQFNDCKGCCHSKRPKKA